MVTVDDRAADALSARLSEFVEQNRLAGGSAGVICGGELAWQAGAGFADLGTGEATYPELLYGIASITKTFTGTAVMQLRDAGRLDLDDPAVRWLPELRSLVNPFGPAEAVTIRRMLSHESGLPTEPPGTDWSVPAYQGDPGQTLPRAADVRVQFPPHTRHKYSDLAYQWLGEIITRVSGTPYPRYVRDAILDPLGMTATAFAPLPGVLSANCATGYQWRGLSDYLDPAPDTPLNWAEGGLWSSVGDLAKWISWHLRAYQPDEDPEDDTAQVLSAASRREMHTPRYLADDQWTQAWGISWCGTRRDDTVWTGHEGGIPGYTSAICFNPAAQVGAVMLVNGSLDHAELAIDLAALARQLSPPEPPAISLPVPAPQDYRPLLGIYAPRDIGRWLLRLEWTAGKLAFIAAVAPGWQVVLAPTADPDLFTITDSGDLSGGSVTFRRLADGRVASVSLMDSTWLRLDQVSPEPQPTQ
jgi:CubicO group peptidase (beta-lactamase class C family)